MKLKESLASFWAQFQDIALKIGKILKKSFFEKFLNSIFMPNKITLRFLRTKYSMNQIAKL